LTSPQSYITDRSGTLVSISPELRRILEYTGFPTVSDNCGQLEVTVSDAIQMNGNCGTMVITRTFTVADKYNSACTGAPNTRSCTQTITVRRATMQDVIMPPFTTHLECDDNFATLANGNPSPSVTGYPYLETAFGFTDINQTYCNLAAQYTDMPRIDGCAGSYEFVRRWTVLNSCNPAQSRQYNQIIRVGDYTAPVVSCPVVNDPFGAPQSPITYSTTPFDCTASFVVPMPTVTDACSVNNWTMTTEIVTDIQVPVLNQFGQQTGTTTQTIVVKTIAHGASRQVTGIPTGNHRFRYTVTDNCGNTTVQECAFRVVDLIEPTAICNNQLNISLGGNGQARVFAADINEGSNDNCGAILIKVRRQPQAGSTAPIAENTPWSDFVDFSCADAATSATPNRRVRVELRVWDDANRNGVAGDAGDLFSTCWLDVLVEDKVRPVCYAPHAMTVSCDALPANFTATDTVMLAQLFNGTNPPSATDNCSATVRELTPIVNLHDCGWGTIRRRFQATDSSGNTSVNTCEQVITIGENHNYWIKFPRDYSANCGDPTIGGVEYEEVGCDLLAVSTQDDTLNASGTECYKIMRTYRVINWCEYNGVDAPVVVGREEECNTTSANNAAGYASKVLSGPNAGQLTTDPRFPNNGIYVIVRGGVIRNAGNQIVTDNRMTWFDSDTDPANNFPAAFQKGTSCDGLSNGAGHWVNGTQKPAIRSRGFWEYTQHIVVYDNVRPTITIPAVSDFCSYDSPTAADPTCEGEVSFPFTVSESCTPNDVTIRAYLDANNDGAFPYDFNVRLNPNGTRTGNTNVFTINGSYPNYTIASTTAQGLPLGTHKFEIVAEDGCGNTQSASVVITVKDCKAPTPICYNGLTVTLMPTPDGAGMAAIWATDFIASDVVDCSAPIKYSIRRAGQQPDINRTGLNFSCADYNASSGSAGTSHVIYIDAWDAAGNRDYCETYVLVQDQAGICVGPATGSVAGVIRTESNQSVEGVTVSLSGPTSNTANTPESGAYSFSNLTLGGDYTVTPVLDANYLNGVSTFDLVLIQRHILGVQPLGSPYKMIAADVNNSRTITTLDVIQLRRLILAIDTELASNTSWRFIPASYVFPVPTNPWFESFPEVINVNDLSGDELNRNFIGVKIGDVNGSAVATLSGVEDRTTRGTYYIETAAQQVKAGEQIKVSIRESEKADLAGYQFTLEYDRSALNLEGIEYGALQEANVGLRYANKGLITVSSNETGKAAMLTLVFTATNGGNLSDLLQVNSAKTRAEAYDRAGNLHEVALRFTNNEITAQARLNQNMPNPFTGETLIGFYLPEGGAAELTLTDLQGKVLQVIRGEYAKGFSEIMVDGQHLPKGVIQYTLTCGEFTATRRMVLVR
jgi:hypothetical protein